MSQIDIDNEKIAGNLVKDYFGLRDESLKRFEEALKKPYMIKPIEEMFKNTTDNRLRFPMEDESLGSLDVGWIEFQDNFPSFIDNEGDNFTYEDYRENRITVGKNRVKLKKALSAFYKKNLRNFETDQSKFGPRGDYSRTSFISFINGYYEETWKLSLRECENSCNGARYTSENEANKEIDSLIEDVLRHSLEYLGTKKMPVRENLEIVVSRNFSDWLLCSTEENWTSCLNLTSRSKPTSIPAGATNQKNENRNNFRFAWRARSTRGGLGKFRKWRNPRDHSRWRFCPRRDCRVVD
jgi:hypothetical protein